MALSGQKDSFQNEKFMRGCRFLEAELQDMDRVLSGRYGFNNSFLDIFLLAYNQRFPWSGFDHVSKEHNVVLAMSFWI